MLVTDLRLSLTNRTESLGSHSRQNRSTGRFSRGGKDASEARLGKPRERGQMGQPFQVPATRRASGNTDPGVVLQGKVMKRSGRDAESGNGNGTES